MPAKRVCLLSFSAPYVPGVLGHSDLRTGMDSPVRPDSSQMQVPLMTTASHGRVQSDSVSLMRSPGTRFSDETEVQTPPWLMVDVPPRPASPIALILTWFAWVILIDMEAQTRTTIIWGEHQMRPPNQSQTRKKVSWYM